MTYIAPINHYTYRNYSLRVENRQRINKNVEGLQKSKRVQLLNRKFPTQQERLIEQKGLYIDKYV